MRTTKKPSGATRVSRTMQLVFIAAAALMWSMSIAMTLFLYAGTEGYVSAGTWAYQVTELLLPLGFVGLSYTYARRAYADRLGQVFFTMLLGVSAFLVFSAFAMFENTLRLHYEWFMSNDYDSNIWNAFGHDWVIMLIGLALFAAVLGWHEKSRK